VRNLLFSCLNQKPPTLSFLRPSRCNLRRELPRIPFVDARAKALDEIAPDAGLKPGSSTKTGSTETAFTETATNETIPEAGSTSEARSTVEERPFRAASENEKKKNSALPKAIAAERSSQATQIFRAFVKAGERLAEIHVHYEQQPEYQLTKTEKKGEKLDYRIKKMKLSKDKTLDRSSR
jgi:Type ISP C-terminal specificity domain